VAQAGDHRPEPALDADERAMLTGFLDFQRATALWKCAGLSAEQMATRLPPSSLTIAGLIHHLALDEDSWFSERFAGVPIEPWSSVDFDADPEWEFRTALEATPEELLARYRAACDRSRAVVAAAASLDQPSVVPDRREQRPFSLRWILVHMIEETARHNGHLDLLREHVDGLTGE
jgi:hypothetical protein